MDKNILITGASKGIGKSIASELKPFGNIFLTARNEQELKAINPCEYCLCDMTCSQDLDKLCHFIKKNKINILINNAGTYVYNPVEKTDIAEIETVLKTNLLTPMYLSSTAAVEMKAQRWGRIINIGSISGVMGEANASIYSGSKSGLIGFSKALALELSEFNITVNVINPGWVDTDLAQNSIENSEFTKTEILDCIPQKRFITPKEVADLIKYLISDEAKGVTGQSINLCAGLSVGF